MTAALRPSREIDGKGRTVRELLAGRTISIEDYVAKYVAANPGAQRADVVKRLHEALHAARAGARCSCGNSIWVVGAVDAGLSCFTCMRARSFAAGWLESPAGTIRPPSNPHPSRMIQAKHIDLGSRC